MNHFIKSCAALMLLSACGGSGGGDAASSQDPEITAGIYVKFSDTQTFSSVLSSAEIVTNQSSGSRSATTQSGSYDHVTAQATLTETSNLRFTNTVSGDYDYVTTYASSDPTSDVSGVVGIATTDADMPMTGGATYTGGAVGVVVTGNSGTDLIDGTSTLVVDFKTGLADLTLNSFTAIDQTNGQPTTAPIDQINVNGMVITGNVFSGDNVSTTLAGADVEITGPNTNAAANGGLFGLDGAIPDEAGGVVLSTGDTGMVFGTFLAD